jgi:hypothetical protein
LKIPWLAWLTSLLRKSIWEFKVRSAARLCLGSAFFFFSLTIESLARSECLPGSPTPTVWWLKVEKPKEWCFFSSF